MALAYAVVPVDKRLYDLQRREAVQAAQHEADRRFEDIAKQARKTLVTRNPEPRVMSHEELRKLLPTGDISSLVGLYFTADIS
ncbi:hypothetical protein SEA_JEMERALD_59 [Microbacterium phage Jemerald]|nr:hypothetical protein SEA_JUICER_59 [Microbacterium phage Juicer]WNO27298.1 hypothetical protein SEA_JEMERALD_59 [Microbacterium phage Jemerald]